MLKSQKPYCGYPVSPRVFLEEPPFLAIETSTFVTSCVGQDYAHAKDSFWVPLLRSLFFMRRSIVTFRKTQKMKIVGIDTGEKRLLEKIEISVYAL